MGFFSWHCARWRVGFFHADRGITVLLSLYDNHHTHFTVLGDFTFHSERGKKINVENLCLNKFRISHERPQKKFKCFFSTIRIQITVKTCLVKHRSRYIPARIQGVFPVCPNTTSCVFVQLEEITAFNPVLSTTRSKRCIFILFPM